MFYVTQEKKSKRFQCLWLENDKRRVNTPFVRFIEGVKLFHFEIVSKTPNMVFLDVSMVFSVGMTSKYAKLAYLRFHTPFM